MSNVIELAPYRSLRFQRTRSIDYDVASSILRRSAHSSLDDVVGALQGAGIAPDIIDYISAGWRRIVEPGVANVRA